MAPKRRPKPKRSSTVPQTAQEKAARSALTTAQQLNLEQQSARNVSASKGAFKGIKLRSGGSDLGRYNLGRFTDDPFPKIHLGGGGGGNGGGGGGGRGGGGGGGGKPKAPTKRISPQEAKRRTTQQRNAQQHNERPGTVNGPNVTEARLERERLAREQAATAAAAKKKAADAAALKKKRQAARDAGGGVTKAPTGGGFTQS